MFAAWQAMCAKQAASAFPFGRLRRPQRTPEEREAEEGIAHHPQRRPQAALAEPDEAPHDLDGEEDDRAQDDREEELARYAHAQRAR